MFNVDPNNSTTIVVDGKIVQSDIEFRSGVKVRETIRAVRSDGLRMYIDIDEDDVPIAVEFVHPDGQDLEYTTIDENDKEAIATAMIDLFAFASQMVFVQRTIQSTMMDLSTDLPSDMRRLSGPLLNRMGGHIFSIRPQEEPDTPVLAT